MKPAPEYWKVKKQSTKDLLTVFTDKLSICFKKKDGTSEDLNGHWCMVYRLVQVSQCKSIIAYHSTGMMKNLSWGKESTKCFMWEAPHLVIRCTMRSISNDVQNWTYLNITMLCQETCWMNARLWRSRIHLIDTLWQWFQDLTNIVGRTFWRQWLNLLYVIIRYEY